LRETGDGNADLVEVPAVGDRAGDISCGDDAYRLAGLEVRDDQGGRAGVLHQVGGRGDRVALGYCLGSQPHDVGDGGRGPWGRLSARPSGSLSMVAGFLRCRG
jgi:hypothetical protein